MKKVGRTIPAVPTLSGASIIASENRNDSFVSIIDTPDCVIINNPGLRTAPGDREFLYRAHILCDKPYDFVMPVCEIVIDAPRLKDFPVP